MTLSAMLLRRCSAVVRSGGLRKRCFSSLPPGASTLPLPALSPTMESGTIARWAVEEQSAFEAGTVLCEIETDKATVDYEAVDDGILARILLAEGTKDVAIGTPIAVVAEDETVAGTLKDMDLSFLTGTNTTVASAPSPEQQPHSTSLAGKADLVAPAAGFLLRSYGVDPSTVLGSVTLPSGLTVITKADALAAVEGHSLVPVAASVPKQQTSAVPAPSTSPAQTPAAAAAAASQQNIANTIMTSGREYEDVQLTSMRKVIASRLTQSKQENPHYYATTECELDNILEFRKALKAKLGKAPSINDMVVKAAALSLRDVPRVNCRLESDGSVVQNDTIDVAVAVATPTGLITPIVRDSDQKGVLQISSDMKDLGSRAKLNKLKLEEFQGGSFTVSNLGMLGISEFTAVINAPQAAILAVGTGRQEFNCDDKDNLRPVNLMTVQLSCDRRIIDEGTVGLFLQCFKEYMSDPMLMSV